MSNKKSFILYQEYQKHIEILSDEQAGKLFKAIFAHNVGEDLQLEPMVQLAFSFIKSDLERNSIKYENKIARNRENGRKGGRPKTQNNPVGFSETQNNPVGFLDNPNNHDDEDEDEGDFLDSLRSSKKEKKESAIALSKKKENSENEKKFDEFWKSWTVTSDQNGRSSGKGARKPTLEKYLQKIQAGATHEKISSAAARYLAECETNSRPSCHVLTFINQERFNDYIEVLDSERYVPSKEEQNIVQQRDNREIERKKRIESKQDFEKQFLKKIREKLGNEIFEKWFKDFMLYDFSDDFVIFSVETKFVRDWIIREYLQILQKFCKKIKIISTQK